MSPEQSSGNVAEIDHRADIFGLGATILTLLTGQTPKDAAFRHKHLKRYSPALASICNKAMAAEPDTYLGAINQMSTLERRFGDNQKALENARLSYDLHLEKFGPVDYRTLHAYDLLASAVFKDGDLEKANDMFQQIYQLRRDHPQKDQTAILVVMRNICHYLVANKNFAGALKMRKEIMDSLVESLGNDHRETRKAMRVYYREMFKYQNTDQAIDELRHMRDSEVDSYTCNKPPVYRTNIMLAWMYRKKAAYDAKLKARGIENTDPETYTRQQSIDLLVDSIERCQNSSLGRSNLMTLNLMEQLAFAYASDRQIENAIQTRDEALKIWHERMQDQDVVHQDYLACLVNHAKLLYQSGQVEKSKELGLRIAELNQR